MDKLKALSGEHAGVIADIAFRLSQGQIDAALALDQIESEALYWLCVGLGKYDADRGESGNKKAFLHWFIYNKIRDYIRRHLHYRASNANLRGMAQAQRIEVCSKNYAEYSTANGEHFEAEVSADIALCLRAANGRTRAMLEMRIEGYTNKEIGKAHGISHARVSQMLGRFIKLYLHPYADQDMLKRRSKGWNNARRKAA